MIENSIRGGISMITKRYAEAKNRFMGDNYNPKKDPVHLLYIDANNLYGWAMSQFMPTGKFKWLSRSEIDKLDVSAFGAEDSTGYILEWDLQYPQSIHADHNDYPLAPERLTITPDMLSLFQKQYPDDYKQTETEKLAPNLYDKEKYTVHYRNLQFYLEQGMKVENVHRVLSFAQSPWLKTYIDIQHGTAKKKVNFTTKQISINWWTTLCLERPKKT
jgi:hypothetical protein